MIFRVTCTKNILYFSLVVFPAPILIKPAACNGPMLQGPNQSLHNYFTHAVTVCNINIAIFINGKSLGREELSSLPGPVRFMKALSHNTRG